MMKIAFQIDEIEKLNFNSDSSLAIMEEAQKRGYEVFYYHPISIYSSSEGIYTSIIKKMLQNLPSKDDEKDLNVNLENFDVIFIRNDPPYDMNYLTLLHLLKKIENKVKFLNRPTSIINHPEKISPMLNFKHHMPETLVSKEFNVVENFVNSQKTSIIKPLYGAAGQDVFLIKNIDPNWKLIAQNLIEKHKQPIICQEFLEEIHTEGDKRVLMARGEVIGVLGRMPENGSIRANMAAGGSSNSSLLSKKQQEICYEIGEFLVREEIFFAGLDLIGNKLTEINITSPTGLKGVENSASNLVDLI